MNNAASLAKMKKDELVELCKQRGISGYSKLKKDELVALLSEAMGDGAEPAAPAEAAEVPAEAKAPAKTETSKWNKFVAWCKRLPNRIATPFKNMWYELKKVSWPNRQMVLQSTKIVIISTVVFALILGLVDFLLLKGIFIIF